MTRGFVLTGVRLQCSPQLYGVFCVSQSYSHNLCRCAVGKLSPLLFFLVLIFQMKTVQSIKVLMFKHQYYCCTSMHEQLRKKNHSFKITLHTWISSPIFMYLRAVKIHVDPMIKDWYNHKDISPCSCSPLSMCLKKLIFKTCL